MSHPIISHRRTHFGATPKRALPRLLPSAYSRRFRSFLLAHLVVHHSTGAPCRASSHEHDYAAHVGLFPDRDSCHPSLHRHAYLASGRLLPAPLLVHPLTMGPYHASLHREACAASNRLLPAQPFGTNLGRASPRLLISITLTPIQSSLIGASIWSISWEVPVMPSSIGTPTPPTAVSYRRTQIVCLPGRPPATPPSIGTPTSPPAVFY